MASNDDFDALSSESSPNDVLIELIRFREQFSNVPSLIDEAVEREFKWPKRILSIFGVSFVGILAFVMVGLPDYTIGRLLAQEVKVASVMQDAIEKAALAERSASEAVETAEKSAEVASVSMSDVTRAVEASKAILALDLVAIERQVEILQAHVAKPEVRSVIELLIRSPVPLGSIIPYFGSELPDGYVWADGQSLWPEDADWLPEHLRGTPVPDMEGRMLRGTDSIDSIAIAAGHDEIPEHNSALDGRHRHAIPQHRHSLPTRTGPISLSTVSGSESPRYAIKDDNANWRTNRTGSDRPHHLAVDGGANNEGQHVHNLGGNTGMSPEDLRTESGGAHSHTIPAVAFVPSHITVRYIIRIQ